MRRLPWRSLVLAMAVSLAAWFLCFYLWRQPPPNDDAAEGVRHERGQQLGYLMLAAFAGDRDYPRTAKLADTLAKHYPDDLFYQYAVGLADQIPKRSDDFIKLKLPRPNEWKTLKGKLTRVERIDFLCERLRLLNCFQRSQPGGVSYYDKQFAEPCGMTRDASWGGFSGKTEVINPLVELSGPSRAPKEAGDQSQGESLTLKDVPQMSKHLKDDWYIPTVSFWRNFHPMRGLHSTRPILGQIINDMAGKDLCEIGRWGKLTPAQIEKEIGRISRWATENAGRTRLELEWNGLEEMVTGGASWPDVKERVQDLFEQNQLKAVEVMKRYLQGQKTPDWDRRRILDVYLEKDVAKSVANDLDDKDGAVRICAAVVLFRAEKSARAQQYLGDALEKNGLQWWTHTAVKALLKEGSAESRRQAVRLFAHEDLYRQESPLNLAVSRDSAMRAFVDAGMVEPYRYYLRQLDNNGLVPAVPGSDQPRKVTWAELHASEMWRVFDFREPALKEIGRAALAEQIPGLKKWLQARIAEKISRRNGQEGGWGGVAVARPARAWERLNSTGHPKAISGPGTRPQASDILARTLA
jgi:hypothetical protein